MSTEEGSAAAGKAQEIFTEAIADPYRRRALANHPEEAFEEAGVNFNALPSQLQALLKDLSYEELRLLSRVQDTLDRAGLIERPQSASGGTICKF
jgi:hypothetical protein